MMADRPYASVELELIDETCAKLVEALSTISAPDRYVDEHGEEAGAHYMDGVSICISEIQRLRPRRVRAAP